MGHLGADVGHPPVLVERVEVLGEGLPVPLDAVGERGAGNVLDAFHHRDQPVSFGRIGRCEPDAAVAHHDRGHAVPARRGELGVPGGLGVEVGVGVDPAGGDDQPVGVDLASTGPDLAAHGSDDVAVDRNVGPPPGPTRAVDEQSPSNHQIVHAETLMRVGGAVERSPVGT